MSERGKSYCESACESCPRMDRIAELEALMATADEVAAKAAYARGFEDAKEKAVEAVERITGGRGNLKNYIRRYSAVDVIRALKPGVK